jgi:hypothetical protein
MAPDPKKPSFSEQLAKLQEERGRSLLPTETSRPERALKSVPAIDDDLIPQVHEQSEDDINVDSIINSIDILDAYRKWIGKEVDEATTKLTEGIKVSCPKPEHRDRHPSAWLNSEKGTWFCGGCQEGGDIYDLAAIHFRFERPGYKDGANFHKLRREMAESYGYHFKTVAGTEVIWHEPTASDQEPTPPAPLSPQIPLPAGPSPVPEADPPSEDREVGVPGEVGSASVSILHEEDVEDVDEEIGYPRLNWQAIIPQDTFLHEYMKATTNDDSPEEYHFWHGLLALGHACGRNVFLSDTRPVYGNLLVCLLGGTGYGKSRSRAWLDELLMEALPFKDNGIDCTGVKIVPVPASGENLIKQFDHVAWDPTNPGKKTFSIHTPVNGIVDYDEFASLLARASRQGSTLKQIIMGMSDSRHKVTTSSNTGGDFEATDPFCSITASTQPKAVRKLLTHTDTGSGFLNRWIFVGGPRKQREVIGGVHSAIRVDLTAAAEELTYVHAWSGNRKELSFNKAALDEFQFFMTNIVFPVQQKDNSDLLTRLDLTMKRLILLFCMNERRDMVTVEVVKAVEPILEYLIRCYAILNAEIGISAMSEVATEILRHIKRITEQTGRGASVRDLSQRMQRKNYSPDLIKRTLETMVALDWIDLDKTNKGPGRPTVRYRAVS